MERRKGTAMINSCGVREQEHMEMGDITTASNNNNNNKNNEDEVIVHSYSRCSYEINLIKLVIQAVCCVSSAGNYSSQLCNIKLKGHEASSENLLLLLLLLLPLLLLLLFNAGKWTNGKTVGLEVLLVGNLGSQQKRLGTAVIVAMG
jgi:hypothetical protein